MVLDDETQFALWNRRERSKRAAAPRVIVAHKDRPIGTSVCQLLCTKGYGAVYAADLVTTQAYLRCWKPDALLIDTRLASDLDYRFVKDVRRKWSTQSYAW